MALKPVPKRIVYKVATGLPPTTSLLMELSAALRQKNTIGKRKQAVGLDASEIRFINLNRRHDPLLVGAFHRVEKGAAAILVDFDETKSELPLQQALARLSDSKVGEFIQGTVFFGVHGNHVLLLQSMTCRDSHFEDYLSWLLNGGNRAEGKDPDPSRQAVMISIEDPPKIAAKLGRGRKVSAVRVGAPFYPAVPAPKGQFAATQTARATFDVSKSRWEALKDFIGSFGESLPEKLEIRPDADESTLRVSIELSCRKKWIDHPAGEILQAFGHALRDADGADVEFELDNGTKITNDQLKVVRTVSVECDRRLPAFESVARRMIEVYKGLIEDGTIIDDRQNGG